MAAQGEWFASRTLPLGPPLLPDEALAHLAVLCEGDAAVFVRALAQFWIDRNPLQAAPPSVSPVKPEGG
jgi:hypothetical protein